MRGFVHCRSSRVLADRHGCERSQFLAAVTALAFIAQLLPFLAVRVSAATIIEPGFQLTTLWSGLNQPTGIGFGGDGRIFVIERDGLVKAFDNAADPSPTTVVDLTSQVHAVADRGLLGLAVDPQFPLRPYLYVLYVVDAPPGGTAPFYNDDCPSSPSGAKDGCPAMGRLARIQVGSDNRIVGQPASLIQGDFWCHQQQGHALDNLEFGPDGALYASSGDGATASFTDWGQHSGAADAIVAPNACGDPPVPAGTALSLPTTEGGALRSQDLRTGGDPAQGSGAIIRIDPDTGAAMSGNPLVGNGIATDDRHIAYGLRNPFRFTFRPGTSEIWVGDVGWNNWEEIDRIVSPTDATVENFGWPCYEGVGRQNAFDSLNVNICENLYAAGSSAVSSPYWTYHHDAPPDPTRCSNDGAAISGLAFAGAPYPAQYHGGLFVGDYVKGCLWMLMPGTNGLPDPANIRTILTGSFPTDLTTGPDGRLYIADIGAGTVSRLDAFGGNAPPIARFTATPPYGPTPLDVTFDASTTTDDGPFDSLEFAWDLDGDGAYDDATGVTASRSYPVSVNVVVGLRVSDGSAATSTSSAVVQPGNSPPRGTILDPVVGMTWASGEQVAFDGTVADDEESLGVSAMRWTVGLFHCVNQTDCHEHPQGTWHGVAGASYPAPEHEYPAYLEIRLHVTDGRGLTTTTTRRIDPRTVAVHFATQPSGLELVVGDTLVTTPATVTTIEGSRISVSATSPQHLAGSWYQFGSWSDGGAASHDIMQPVPGTTYTATYEGGSPGAALLVVGDPAALSTGDAAVRARLQALGYTVSVVDDSASLPGDATGKRLVLISSTVSASNVTTKFRTTTVPVIGWEHALFDDLGMTAATGTQVSGYRDLVIGAPSHPLAAGRTGTVNVATATTNFAVGTPNGAATVVATIPGTATPAIFAYDNGAAMPGLAAPARRVGFFLGEVTAASFTPNGLALFDAAVNWAVGVTGGPTRPTPTPRPECRPRRRSRPLCRPPRRRRAPTPVPTRRADAESHTRANAESHTRANAESHTSTGRRRAPGRRRSRDTQHR